MALSTVVINDVIKFSIDDVGMSKLMLAVLEV